MFLEFTPPCSSFCFPSCTDCLTPGSVLAVGLVPSSQGLFTEGWRSQMMASVPSTCDAHTFWIPDAQENGDSTIIATWIMELNADFKNLRAQARELDNSELRLPKANPGLIPPFPGARKIGKQEYSPLAGACTTSGKVSYFYFLPS